MCMHVLLPPPEGIHGSAFAHDEHSETTTTAHNPGGGGADRGQGSALHLHH